VGQGTATAARQTCPSFDRPLPTARRTTLPPPPPPLAAYRTAIALGEPFGPDAGHDPDDRPADLSGRTLSVPVGANDLLDALTVPHPAPDLTVAP